MPDYPKEAAFKARDALAGLCDDIGDFMDSSSLLPLPGSPARQELDDRVLADRLLDAYHQGNLMLESAVDHAYGLTLLLVEPLPTVAPWTCVRGGLEAAAIACWLITEGIPPRERVSRSFAWRYEGLREQQKLARSAGDHKVRQQLEKRVDEVEEKALALGYSSVLDRNGKRIGIGQKMPSKTQCIKAMFDQETMYRIFSSMAHSQPTSMVQLGFVPFDPSVPTIMQKAMTSSAALVLVIAAANVVARPSWVKARLYGLDTKRLKAILEGRYDEMGANESQAFWRSDPA